MIEVALVLVFMSIGIAYIAVQEDRQFKLQEKIRDGFKPDAKDGDGDGKVQDGTKWERKV